MSLTTLNSNALGRLRALILGARQHNTRAGIAKALAYCDRMSSRAHRRHPEAVSICAGTLRSLSPGHHREILELVTQTIDTAAAKGHYTRAYRLTPTSEEIESLIDLVASQQPATKQQTHRPIDAKLLSSLKVSDRIAYKAWTLSGCPTEQHRSINPRTGKEAKQGRRYNPMQSFSKELKVLLFEGSGYMDIDMTAAHPTILTALFPGALPTLESWLAQPAAIRRSTKVGVLKTLNGGRPRNGLCRALRSELLQLQPQLRRAARELGLDIWGPDGTLRRDLVFRICEVWEDRLLTAAEAFISSLGKRVHIPMFDGMICDPLTPDELSLLHVAVSSAHPQIPMKWAVKATF